MKREFSINLILLIGINLLVKPFYIFGIDRTVQNVVGPEVYGLYFAIFNFTFLFYIINDFGLQNFNNRLIAQNRRQIGRYLPSILGLKVILSIVYFITIYAIGSLLGYFPEHWEILLFLGLNQTLIALMYYLRSNVSGLGFYRTDSIMSAMDRFIMILICGWLLWFSPFKENFQIEYFVYAQTASLGITNLILIILLFPKAKLTGFRFDWRSWRVILKSSLPFALVIVLMTLYSRLDSVMIERMLLDGKYEAGVYASAYRLLDAFNMFGFLIAGLLLPIFSRMIKKAESVVPLFRQALLLVFSISGALTILGIVFRLEIMELLYLDSTDYWGKILGYLLPVYLFTSAIYVIGTYLTAKGDLKILNKILAVGVVLNVVLNLLLIPEYKAWGATIATLITQCLMFAAQWLLAKKGLNLKLRVQDVLQLLSYLLVMFFVVYAINSQMSIIWQMKFCLGILVSILLAFMFKLMDTNMIVGLFNQRKAS